eukprot:1938691-Prymnesium_polylepis.1
MPARKRRKTTRKTKTTFLKPTERHRPCLRMPPQPFPVPLSLLLFRRFCSCRRRCRRFCRFLFPPG